MVLRLTRKKGRVRKRERGRPLEMKRKLGIRVKGVMQKAQRRVQSLDKGQFSLRQAGRILVEILAE
jgi:hypothetical protein